MGWSTKRPQFPQLKSSKLQEGDSDTQAQESNTGTVATRTQMITRKTTNDLQAIFSWVLRIIYNSPIPLNSSVLDMSDLKVAKAPSSTTGSKNCQSNTIKVPPFPYINKLPSEILGQVAIFLASIDTERVLKFAAVCRHWRASVLSTSEVWSYIHIRTVRNRAAKAVNGGTTKNPNEFACLDHKQQLIKVPVDSDILLWIQRAKAHKLNISFEDFNAVRFFDFIISTKEIYKATSIWRRIKRLHFEYLPSDFGRTLTRNLSDDKHTFHYDFDELEALSVKYTRTSGNSSYTPPNFPEIAKFFFGRQSQSLLASSLGNKISINRKYPVPGPKHLSLEGVTFTSERPNSYPIPSTLTSLRLVGCNDQIALTDVLIQVRTNLTDIYLALQSLSLGPPRENMSGHEEHIIRGGRPFIEFPSLKQMTLELIKGSSGPTNVLKIFSCPRLTHLTCDDGFLVRDKLLEINFPALTHLFINFREDNNAKMVQHCLPYLNSKLSTLALFNSAYYNEWEVDVFIWNTVLRGCIGKHLKVLRYIAVDEQHCGSMLSKPILEQLIRGNRKQAPEPPERDIAISVRVLLISFEQAAKQSGHWDMDWWWTREVLWE